MSCSTNPFRQCSSQSVFGQLNNYSGLFGATQTSSVFSSGASSSPMPAFGVSYTPSFGLSGFGQKPAFEGIHSTPTQTSPYFASAILPPQPAFGSNIQQSQPAFGSSIFDSSIPVCASSQPAFDSKSTPAFGTTSTPAFGATTVPTFVSTESVFGTSSAPVFGGEGAFATSSSPVFGSSSTSAFGASSSPAFGFGSSTQASGQSSSAFGTSSSVGSTNSTFGGQSSAFGSHTPTQTFENAGIGQSEFGRQRGGSRVASYSATTEPDGDFGRPGKCESISTMLAYKDRSHEELRWEDYQLGDKGGPLAYAPQSTGMEGFKSYATQTNAFSPSLVFAQSSANPFSGTIPNSNNLFAPKTSTFSSGFGTSAPTFSSYAFGSSSTSAFGTSSSLGSGASRFVGHRRGSRVASYSPTTEPDGDSGKLGKFQSISTMSIYKDKNHEELRWEDYQLGTKDFRQSSSRPLGSFQSVFGKQNNSSYNPSASKPFGSPTPLGLQTGTSTSAGVFGATQTLSPFSFNSLMPATGASSTSAFGNSSAPFGGLSVFGQKPSFGEFRSTPTQTNPFVSAIQQPQPTLGSNTQQSQPAFGRSIFDSSTPFCASSQPIFGSTSTPDFRATNTPAYGATTPAFSFVSSSTSAFGGSISPAFSFGSSTQACGQSSTAFGTSIPFGSTTSASGGQSSVFGSHTLTQTFENTGIGQSEFGRQRGGSRVASYSATTEPDGDFGKLGKIHSISTMSTYKDKSHEELRWEDYQLGDKGGPLASAPRLTDMAGFNSSMTPTNAFSPSLVFGQSSANPFSSTIPNSNNPCAPKASSFSSGFGTSAPALSSSTFGSSSMPAFGTSSSLAVGASCIPAFSFDSSTKGCGMSSSAFGTCFPFGNSTSAFGGQSFLFDGKCKFGDGGEEKQFVDTDIRSSGQIEKFESISAILVYKDKSHEELRWEDYQLCSSAPKSFFRPSSFFSSLSSGLSESIFSSMASLTSNAPDRVVPYQVRDSMVPLAILTGTVLATVAVSGCILLRCRRA